MANLSEVKQDSLFCLLKGEPGTRKSTNALSFPKPQYWFSIDQKMDALMIPARNWKVDTKEVEFHNYTDYNMKTNMLKKLEELQLNCKYKTIVVDSCTSFGDIVNRQTIKMKTGTTTAAGQAKGNAVGGINVNTMEDYKAEAAAFGEMIAILKDVAAYHKVNVVLIAHVIGERPASDASTHFSRIIVTGGKIISAKIPAYCSEVYHHNIDKAIDVSQEGDYCVLTSHTGDDFARTSLPLPKKIKVNGMSLYDQFIKPAIDKNNSNPNPVLSLVP